MSRFGDRACFRMTLMAVVVLALVIGQTACGIKTAPRPGRDFLPDRVTGVTYEFDEESRLVVTFAPPTKTVTGSPLKDLSGFYIDRADHAVTDDFCATCPVNYTKRIEIEVVPPPATIHVVETTYRFEDRLEAGRVYVYRFYAHDCRGRYDPDRFETLMVYFDSPARPPSSPQVKTEDKLVVIDWPATTQLTDGRPLSDLVGYDVFRREAAGPWNKLNQAGPLDRTSYQDTQAKNQQTYEYKVRTVRQWRETKIAGPFSPVVSATPVDLTPPPPPVKLYAVSFNEGIKLSWLEVRVPDLAGYRIYRRLGKGKFERIGPDLITDNLFLDTNVRADVEYNYQVTAVDSAPAANESQPSPEIRVRHRP